MTLLYAIILGTAFGFILEKTGAANPKRVIDMLRLTDFHLMKAILFAIATGCFLLYAFMALEFFPATHLSIKANYIGVAVGGGLLGLGWAISGYCPGTGIVGASAGRKDGLFFLVGACIGAFLYMATYSTFADSFLFNPLFGDKDTLANGYHAPVAALPAELRSLGIAAYVSGILMVFAWLLPTSKNDRIY